MSHASAFIAPLGKSLGIATAHTSTLVGLEARPLRVEVACTRGPSFFQLVGLAEAAVRESRVRVASALCQLGILLDEYAITVNLAPADLKKSGASLDLAILCGVLAAIDRLPKHRLEGVELFGELSLDGTLRPVRGMLPLLDGGRARGLTQAVVPLDNAAEAGLVEGVAVHAARNIQEVVGHLSGTHPVATVPATPFAPEYEVGIGTDLADVRGQTLARRALEIAAAGGHNLLFIGPPGGGKTMLARLLPTVLPPPTYEEAIETTKVHSVAGLVDAAKGVVATRPFRAPHHTVSEPGLVGGGEIPRPGEVSLAHNGVLFLDELAEFRRSALEALRQPLEDGVVCIARARARAWFPARPTVVAAVNPCPCGYATHPSRPCSCSERRIATYRSRLSGPLLDRLDVHVPVGPVDVRSLVRHRRAESSAEVRARVLAARRVQLERYERGVATARLNAHLPVRDLASVAPLDERSERLLGQAVESLGLSARAFAKIVRVARTIADLEGDARVTPEHVSEAIQGRLAGRKKTR